MYVNTSKRQELRVTKVVAVLNKCSRHHHVFFLYIYQIYNKFTVWSDSLHLKVKPCPLFDRPHTVLDAKRPVPILAPA